MDLGIRNMLLELTVALLLEHFTCLAVLMISPSVDDNTSVRAILDAFVTNRDGFMFGEGEYLVYDGFAKTMDEAVGIELETAETCRVFWAFKGTTCRYDCIYDPEKTKATVRKLEGGITSASYMSTRRLTDGKRTLYVEVPWDKTVVETGTVEHGVERFLPQDVIMPTPLLLGFPKRTNPPHLFDFASALELGVAQQLGYEVKPEAEEQKDGKTLIRLAFYQDGVLRRKYWVSIEQGGIPVRMDYFWKKGSEIFTRIENRSIVQHSNGHWLPHVVRLVQFNPNKFSIRELSITRFNADRAPTDNSLRVPLCQTDSACRLIDKIENQLCSIKEPCWFGFGDLALPLLRGQVHLIPQNNSESESFDQIFPSRGSKSAWIGVALTCVGLLIFAAGLVVVWKWARG